MPYELPFIAVTERVFAQLLNERYELLQRNMAGDVLAEALTGRLYPEELQARLRPFGIGEHAAVLAFALREPAAAAAGLEAILERLGVHALVALRNGLLCAVVDCPEPSPAHAHARAHAPAHARPRARGRPRDAPRTRTRTPSRTPPRTRTGPHLASMTPPPTRSSSQGACARSCARASAKCGPRRAGLLPRTC